MTDDPKELKRLLFNAQQEAKDMAFNFRVTNKAYVIADMKLREMQDNLHELEEQRAWLEWQLRLASSTTATAGATPGP
jgi:hypothetical protein